MNKTLTIRWLAVVLAGAFILTGFRSDKPAYRLLTGEGKKADFAKLVKTATGVDVIFFGELHNNPISHWVRFELASALLKEKQDNLILAAEMFEADNQLLLTEYVSGTITERSFETQARLWPNYKTDYKPLTKLARDNRLQFIASNVPRRYAAIVNSGGFEALEELSPQAKSLIAPLPIPYNPDLGCYSKMMEMQETGMGGRPSPNFPKAQAIKDATMAYFISSQAGAGKTILHFHGAFHSDNYEGIVWYLNQYKPGLKVLTITTVEQDTLDTLSEDKRGVADFVIVVPSTMTKTH